MFMKVFFWHSLFFTNASLLDVLFIGFVIYIRLWNPWCSATAIKECIFSQVKGFTAQLVLEFYTSTPVSEPQNLYSFCSREINSDMWWNSNLNKSWYTPTPTYFEDQIAHCGLRMHYITCLLWCTWYCEDVHWTLSDLRKYTGHSILDSSCNVCFGVSLSDGCHTNYVQREIYGLSMYVWWSWYWTDVLWNLLSYFSFWHKFLIVQPSICWYSHAWSLQILLSFYVSHFCLCFS